MEEQDTLTIPTNERTVTSLIKAALLAPVTMLMAIVALLACLACPPAVAALFCGVALLGVAIQASLLFTAFFGTFRLAVEREDDSDSDDSDDDE